MIPFLSFKLGIVLSILPYGAKAVMGLFCLVLNMFGSSGHMKIQYDYDTQRENGLGLEFAYSNTK